MADIGSTSLMRILLPALMVFVPACTFLLTGWSADLLKGIEAYANGDFPAALRELKPLAKQGDVEAQGMLGIMYDRGNGVPQDYKIALKWWNIAASRGHKEAAKYRDTIAARITPAEITKAQDLARNCVENDYKGC